MLLPLFTPASSSMQYCDALRLGLPRKSAHQSFTGVHNPRILPCIALNCPELHWPAPFNRSQLWLIQLRGKARSGALSHTCLENSLRDFCKGDRVGFRLKGKLFWVLLVSDFVPWYPASSWCGLAHLLYVHLPKVTLL